MRCLNIKKIFVCIFLIVITNCSLLSNVFASTIVSIFSPKGIMDNHITMRNIETDKILFFGKLDIMFNRDMNSFYLLISKEKPSKERFSFIKDYDESMKIYLSKSDFDLFRNNLIKTDEWQNIAQKNNVILTKELPNSPLNLTVNEVASYKVMDKKIRFIFHSRESTIKKTNFPILSDLEIVIGESMSFKIHMIMRHFILEAIAPADIENIINPNKAIEEGKKMEYLFQ